MNLREFFKFTKSFKIFFILWSLLLVGFIIAFIIFSNLADKRILEAAVTLRSFPPIQSSDIYRYETKIHFPSNIFRFQRNISNIEILTYMWDIDSHSFNPIYENGKLYLETKETMQNANQIIGKITYKTDFIPSFILDLCLYYILGLLLWFPCRFSCITLLQYISSLPSRSYPTDSYLILTYKDNLFLSTVIMLCIGLFAFQFWLGFPGQITWDTYVMISLDKTNWFPVLISYFLEFLYILFGKHSYYLFLCNLIPFYIGLAFLVCGFYIRFRTSLALIFIFPLFIGNFYFQNFMQHNSFSLPMMLFCLYAMMIFYLLTKPVLRYTKPIFTVFWVCFFILMFCTLLWRHNAIFSVFPLWFVLIYLFLSNRNLDTKAFKTYYRNFMLFSALITLAIVILVPKILTKNYSYPANHIFLHQIAGACVPSNDSGCFPQEWFPPNTTFDDVKELYIKYPLYADAFHSLKLHAPNLTKQWRESIMRHPINFLQHEWRFMQDMWLQKPDLPDVKDLQVKPSHSWMIEIINGFPDNEHFISLTPCKEKIYMFLYQHKIIFNHIVGVVMAWIVLLISGFLLYRKKYVNALLIFAFSSAFAAIGSALMIVLFSPVTAARYMSPVLPVSLMALIGFIAFFWDKNKKYKRHQLI